MNLEQLLAKIAELESKISAAEGAKKTELEKELSTTRTELAKVIKDKEEFEKTSKAKIEEMEKENAKLREKQIDMELESYLKAGKLLPTQKDSARKLMVAGQGDLVKDLFEKNVTVAARPGDARAADRGGDSAPSGKKVRVMRESELKSLTHTQIRPLIAEMEKKELVVLPDEQFAANMTLFEKSGNEEFTDYSTAINQLNTGSWLIPRIIESKVLWEVEAGRFGFDELALPATRADGHTIQWNVIGTLAVLGSSTGVGTVTGTSSFAITTVTASPQRYGNSVSWTGEVNDWSVTEVKNNIAYIALFEDYRRCMDTEAIKVLVAANATKSANTVVGGTWGCGTANLGSVGTFNDEGAISNNNLIMAKSRLIINKAMLWPGDECYCFLSPKQAYSIQTGTAWIAAMSYADSGKLLSGEIGKYMGIHLVLNSQLDSLTESQRKTAAGTGTSVTAVMIGRQALLKGFDMPFTLKYYDDDKNDAGYYKKLQWNARGRYACGKASEVIPIETTRANVWY